jgi:hypothetical protein
MNEGASAYSPQRCHSGADIHHLAVIAGLDPAIPITGARPRLNYRDGRVEPGHDELMNHI